jgi:DNA-binding SARP family transcriptional activator
VRVRLFGPLEIDIDGRTLGPRDFGGIKPKQVLEILLVERGRPVAKERLADLLWGDDLPRNIAATLETYV